MPKEACFVFQPENGLLQTLFTGQNQPSQRCCIFFHLKQEKDEKKEKFSKKRVYQHLSATPKRWLTPKCWWTPWENILFLDFKQKSHVDTF